MHILTNPNEQVLGALRNLAQDHDGQLVLSWLLESRSALATKSTRTAAQPSCQWQQGAVQALDDVFDCVNAAQKQR